ncbi:hypothetical protein DQ04_14671020 [Trypanosoma grayi]|uniref:hypothetical protein n=1 Tax=Trypanosoma grayi TaxID=71804 RepID=UPI0004F3FA81|nr:hypothetical protein DQ04_14671020 [Trypanosoma grayi]KEG06313.1 hypothetical protein DQ04_14671020 [Trypanosoma grayi]
MNSGAISLCGSLYPGQCGTRNFTRAEFIAPYTNHGVDLSTALFHRHGNRWSHQGITFFWLPGFVIEEDAPILRKSFLQSANRATIVSDLNRKPYVTALKYKANRYAMRRWTPAA